LEINVAKSRVHVIARDNGWAVKREGASRAARIHGKKSDAIEHARSIPRRDVIIHKKDGSIQRWEHSGDNR
jgi:hypothetical protein